MKVDEKTRAVVARAMFDDEFPACDAKSPEAIEHHWAVVCGIYEERAESAITAYEAAKTAEGPVAWRDMSTAPRDGTRFLATGGGLGADIDIVSYSERVGCWNATNFTLDDTDHEPEGYNRPSRWQPLPPPQVPHE